VEWSTSKQEVLIESRVWQCSSSISVHGCAVPV
jgi:hypothetical protein